MGYFALDNYAGQNVALSRQGITPVMSGNIHKYKSFATGFSGYPQSKALVHTAKYGRRFARGKDRTGGYYGRYGTRRIGSNAEKKFHDVTDAANSFTTAGAVISLNLIPQGTTELTRVGRKAWIKSISLRLHIQISPQASTQLPVGTECRIIIVQDTQCNGALPAVLDFLETAGQLSYRKLANQTRFRVLKDWIWVLDSPGGAGDGSAANDWSGVQRLKRWYKKCNIPLEFDNTAGAITEIMSNNVFLLAIANNTTGSWGLQSRIRFTD